MTAPPTRYAVRGDVAADGAGQVEAGTETVTFDGSWA
jgi:hypothetical protein